MIVEIRNAVKSMLKRELSFYTNRAKVESFMSNKSVLAVDTGRKVQFFLVSKALEKTFNEIPFSQGLFYAGIFAGEVEKNIFAPSLAVLDFLSKNTDKKFVKLDYKRSVLFSCGRDIPSAGIVSASKDLRKNDIIIVLNENNEGIGYGRVLEQGIVLQELKAKPVIKNLYDIGDFIRREQGLKRAVNKENE